METLLEEQRQAVADEDFERAAAIGDELKKLRAEEAAEKQTAAANADATAAPAESPTDAGEANDTEDKAADTSAE